MFAALTRFFSNISLSTRRESIDFDASEETSIALSDFPVELDDCLACTESKPVTELHVAPCGHAYCRNCTIKMFEDSVKDESVYPPRCCRQKLELESVGEALGPQFVERFMLKDIEVASPNRTYCHVLTCSAFILPCDITNGLGLCESCSAATCTQCKQAAHDGDCATASHAAVLDLAKEQGWRSCSRCHAIVELRDGCNHIT